MNNNKNVLFAVALAAAVLFLWQYFVATPSMKAEQARQAASLIFNYENSVKAYEGRYLGLLDKVFILIGVGPLRSAKTAEWMRKNVPGMHVPDALIKRLAGATDQVREGRNFCIELIQELRTIKGVSGVHVMAYRQEELAAEIIEQSGALQGRVPWRPSTDTQDLTHRNAS